MVLVSGQQCYKIREVVPEESDLGQDRVQLQEAGLSHGEEGTGFLSAGAGRHKSSEMHKDPFLGLTLPKVGRVRVASAFWEPRGVLFSADPRGAVFQVTFGELSLRRSEELSLEVRSYLLVEEKHETKK